MQVKIYRKYFNHSAGDKDIRRYKKIYENSSAGNSYDSVIEKYYNPLKHGLFNNYSIDCGLIMDYELRSESGKQRVITYDIIPACNLWKAVSMKVVIE